MERHQIIKHMLSVIGEAGVSPTLTSHPSVLAATEILETVDLDFQQRGWWFNTIKQIKLVPDSNGRITVPQSALSATISAVATATPVEKTRYVPRNGMMYDTYKVTDIIGLTLTVDLVQRLPVEFIPPVAASYLMHKAAETIYLDDDGEQFKTERLERRTGMAWQLLKQAEMQAISLNALDTPHAQWMRAGMQGGSGRGFSRLDGGSA